jgi:putative ATP-dependent DNA ligase
VCAFSRGGFLDAFVTEKAGEMGFERFFSDYPDAVLCAEMIGNTPYTPPSGDFDVKLFVFDIDAGDGSYVPCARRYELVKKYDMNGVPRLGRFRSDDYKGLGRLALTLNKAKKEGMVLKSGDRAKAVKYVTPWSDIDDIARNARLLFDMPIGFYYQRVLRSAFFISDFGLDREEYSERLGKAFYDGLTKAISEARQGRDIDEEFEISVRDARVWEEVRRHMSKEVRLEELWRRSEDGRTRIRFRKIYKRTTKTLTAYAGGKGITD